ncbi:hypothetical protein [Agromyces kandeliae]|uniref:Squalene cyclase n=1 Tax=Agromyces kandeliae TaxID=2666141 RepID=A0A6L5R5T8_9MICO|nr:hypothetical protein [Agromyces kandeliae]MRX44698.1 hypothetical protein [Agromyces kandeliae]
MRDDVITWLLGGDPSVRWQVMRDLQDAPDDAVATERARVATEGWGARLLAEQGDDGYWGGQVYGSGRERDSVMWTLQVLRNLGAPPGAAPVRAAIDRVVDGVVWAEFDDLPYFSGEVEECVNGGVLANAAYFGVLGAGSDRIVARLLDETLPDGGWNCEPADESQRSSFDSTLCVVEGLLAYERATGSTDAAVTDARRGGEEYLLERSLFRRKSTGELVKPRYTNFSFPTYWFYDVLRALDHFRDAGGRPDARLRPALDLVLGQRDDDGRWRAGDRWPGRNRYEIDAPAGEPSPWNTLRALRVLRWADPASID